MPQKKTPLERRIRPSVPIEIAPGVTLRLSFSMNTLARIEERVNQERLAMLSRRITDPKELARAFDRTKLNLAGSIFTLWGAASSYEVLRTAFWAAAVENHPEYDSEEGFEIVTSQVDTSNVDVVGTTLMEAYELFLSKSQRELFRKTVEQAKSEASDRNPPPPASPETEPAAAGESSPGQNSGPSPDTTSASAASASSAS